jgi:hypothetical protein
MRALKPVPSLDIDPTCRQPRCGLTATLILAMVASLGMVPSRAEVSVDALYDLRHTTDPQDNANNFPVLEIKAFFPLSFGSFLMKEEIDLDGTRHNPSQVYTEITQSIKLGSLKLGRLPLFAHLGYSGGLGVFGNGAGGYYIANAYNVGFEYPFEIRKAFCNVSIAARRASLTQPSYDPMLTAYAGRFFFNYKLLIANSLEAWTLAYDQANTATEPRRGKFAAWEIETEVWYKVAKNLSVGTYTRTTRNVYAISNRWLVFPSFGIRYSF